MKSSAKQTPIEIISKHKVPWVAPENGLQEIGEDFWAKKARQVIWLAPGILSPDEKVALYEKGVYYVHDAAGDSGMLEKKCRSLAQELGETQSLKSSLDKVQTKYKKQKEDLNHQTDVFHMAVHDLKSPLAAMICYAEMLMDGVLEDLNHLETKPIQIIHQNCKFLIQLVDDLLESSKIEAGKKQIFLEPILLDDLVRSISDTVGGLARAKDIQLTLDLDSGEPCHLNRRMMERVLLNLFSNAVKFTKMGGAIVVKTFTKGGKVVFSIQDMGPGIPKKDILNIFQKFNTGESSSISGKGHGLGLAITKTFVEFQNGKIFVRSKRHKGSTFLIQFDAPGPQKNGIISTNDKGLDRAEASASSKKA